MINSDFKAFSLIMHDLANEYGGELSSLMIESKFKQLIEYRIEQIQEAGNQLLKYREVRYPAVPTNQEFIKIIEKNTVSFKSKAVFQANQVIKAISQYSPHYPARFKDPITAHIMKNIWSLKELALKKVKDNTWLKKEFIELYLSLEEISLKDETLKIEGKPNKQLARLAKNITKKIGG